MIVAIPTTSTLILNYTRHTHCKILRIFILRIFILRIFFIKIFRIIRIIIRIMRIKFLNFYITNKNKIK